VAVVVRKGISRHNSSLALCASTPLLFRKTVYANLKEHKNTINPKGRHRRRLRRKNTNVDLKEKTNINVDPKEKP
jgi:hypothetical protein